MLLLATVPLAAGVPSLRSEADLVGLYARMAPDHPRTPRQLLVDLPPDSDLPRLADAVRAVPGVQRVDAPMASEPLLDEVAPRDRDAARHALLGRPATERRMMTVTLHDDVEVDLRPLLPDARMTGLPLLQAAHETAARTEQLRMALVLTPGLFLALWGIVRRALDAALVLSAVAVGALAFAGGLGWAGVSLGGPNLLLLPLVIVLGLSDGLHLVHRATHLEHEGRDLPSLRALSDVAGPCAVTSSTTALSFVALTISPSPAVRQFGLLAALGVGVSWLAGLLLPAAGLTFRSPALSEDRASPSRWRVPDLRWTAVALLFLALPTMLLTRLDLGVDRPLPDADPTLAELRAVDASLGGVHGIRWSLETGAPDGIDDPRALRAVLRVHQVLQSSPEVGAVFSYADPLTWIAHEQKQQPTFLVADRPGHPLGDRPLRRVQRAIARHLDELPLALVDDDRSAFSVYARLHDGGAADWRPVLDRIERTGSTFATVEAFGYPALVVAAYQTLPAEMLRVLASSAVGVLVVVGLRTRSAYATLGGIALLGGVLVCTLAALVVLGRPLSQTNLFVLSLAMGLGLDGWIHLVTSTSRTVVGAVSRSSALSVAGFLLLATSDLPTVRGIGLTLAAATVSTWVLTLALHQTLGRRLGGADAVP